MEIIFILLLLIWILTQFLSRQPAPGETGHKSPRDHRVSGTERPYGTAFNEPSSGETEPPGARPPLRNRGESASSYPEPEIPISSPDSERGSARRSTGGLTPGRVRERLKSHRSRREIFLLKELLDRPRSQRPWPS